jgi:hypothetical protein
MGAKIRHLGGYQSGDHSVNVHTDPYVQGQPLKFNTSGQLELCKCYREGHDDGYCGLAKGWSGAATIAARLSDIYNGNGTYFAGFNQLKLDHDDPRNEEDEYPFDTAPIYHPGDDLYINILGQLTNNHPDGNPGYTAVCDDATPIAYVLQVGANNSYLIINQVR